MKGDKSNLGKLVDRVLLDSLETLVRSIKNPTVLNQVSDLTRRWPDHEKYTTHTKLFFFFASYFWTAFLNNHLSLFTPGRQRSWFKL